MQANNPGQGGTGGNSNKHNSGLSWTSPPSAPNTTSPLLGGAKPAQPAAAKPAVTAPIVAKPVINIKPREKTDSTGRGTIAGSFIGGVIVGGLLVGGWYALTPSSAPATTNTAANTSTNTTASAQTGAAVGTISAGSGASTAPAASAANNLVVTTPQNAGSEVVIADATVSVPTWIVVYETYQGKPVRALGATMFFPEYNGKGGVIHLLRATQPNTEYFVGQAVDDGDHIFTPHVDKEVLDRAGGAAGARLMTR